MSMNPSMEVLRVLKKNEETGPEIALISIGTGFNNYRHLPGFKKFGRASRYIATAQEWANIAPDAVDRDIRHMSLNGQGFPYFRFDVGRYRKLVPGDAWDNTKSRSSGNDTVRKCTQAYLSRPKTRDSLEKLARLLVQQRIRRSAAGPTRLDTPKGFSTMAKP